MAEFSSRKGWVAFVYGSVVLAMASSSAAQTQAPHAAFSAATPAAPPPPPSPPPPSGPPPVAPATSSAPAAQPAPAPGNAPVAPVEPAAPSTPPPPPSPPPPAAPVEPPPPTMAVAYTMPASLPACTTHATPSPCAQPPDAYRHEGFYLRLAGGLNYAAFGGTGGGRDVSIHGLTQGATLAIGGTIADGFVLAGVLGGEQVRDTFHGGPRPERNATVAFGELGALVDYYPKPTDGWHFGAVVALGAITLSDAGLPRDATGASFAGTLFGGYDFWIGPEWSLGLMLTFSGATTGTLKDSDSNDSGYRLHALSAGLSYTFTLH